MICWMGKMTNKILDRHDVSVIGFDVERDAKNARVNVDLNGTALGVNLGNVEGLSHRQIERRFAAAMLQFAIEAAEDGDDEGYEVLDELLEGLCRKENEDGDKKAE